MRSLPPKQKAVAEIQHVVNRPEPIPQLSELLVGRRERIRNKVKSGKKGGVGG